MDKRNDFLMLVWYSVLVCDAEWFNGFSLDKVLLWAYREKSFWLELKDYF